MSKRRLFLVTLEPPPTEDTVVPLRTTLVLPGPALAASPGALPRETSWRDLVRRLQKKLARR